MVFKVFSSSNFGHIHARWKRHYLAVKILHGINDGLTIIWKVHNYYQYYTDCLNLFRTKNKLKSQTWMYARIIIIVIWKYLRQGTKCLSLFKILSLLIFHLLFMQTQSFCLIKCKPVIIIWQNRLHKKLKKYAVCGYSLFTQCSCDKNNNKHNCYRIKDSMKTCWLEIVV